MKSTIAITKQWQMHIPKAVREALGLEAPTAVEVEVKNGKMIVAPRMDSPLHDAGKYTSYAKGKTIDLDNIRDQIDYS